MPVLRTAENADIICRFIAEGLSLRQIAKHHLGFSGKSAITEWIRDDPEFAARYARAKEAQADHFAEELLEIADDATNDWVEREGKTLVDYENINRSKLRVDTRKWLMAKMLPRKYGDRLELEHSGELSFAEHLISARDRLKLVEAPLIENDDAG